MSTAGRERLLFVSNESQFIRNVSLTPMPSLWGHSAGSGGNAVDNDFINVQVRRFLER
jgi:homoserine O-acetyltransferase/O-succinyltransferase